MTLSYNTLKPLVGMLIFIVFVTTFLQFASLVAVQEARAQLVVTDPGNTITQWVIDALKVARDVAVEAAKRAWEWTKDKAIDALKWARDNTLAILMAAGLKLAARFLLAEVERLMSRRSIQSYLYYADFLVRNVYVIEQITKRYPVRDANGEYSPSDERDRLILFNLISEGRQLYSRLEPGTPAYEGIKQATLFNPRCQTYNLSPQSPTYYAELLASKGPDCVPQFVVASYRDAALSDLAAAEQAAQQEIAAGQGFQSGRQCGTVATSDVFNVDLNGETLETEYTQAELNELGDLPEGATPVKAGEEVEVLPTISSVLCTLITYPAGQTATVVNSMIDRIININTAPPQGVSQNTAAMRSFLSDTMATSMYRLLQSCNGNSVVRFIQSNTRLSSSCTQEDRNFVNQLPDLNVDNIDSSIDLGSATSFNARDEKRLNEYWRDMCEERLPLLFSWSNNRYPGASSAYPADGNGQIYPLAIGELRAGAIVPIGSAGRHNYLPARSQLLSNFSSTEPGKLDINKMLNTPLNPAFGNSTSRDNGDYGSSRSVTYSYIWKIHEDKRDSTDTGFDDELPLGRKYWMSRYGFPNADDIKGSTEWLPLSWPYWLDRDGLGYVWPPFGLGSGKEKYTDLGAAKLYRVTASGTTEYMSVPSNALQKVYETTGGNILFAWSPTPYIPSAFGSSISANLQMRNGNVYKLNKAVTVVVNNGQVQINPDSYRSTGGDSFFVEYTDAGGEKKVLAAELLERQAPCAQQPYGPPTNLVDIQPKLQYSEDISKPLWDWVMEKIFIQENKGR